MDFDVAYLPTENNRATHSRLQTGRRRAGESLIDRLGAESSANFTIPLRSNSPRRIFRASSSSREAFPHRFSPRIIGRAGLERGSLKHSKLPPDLGTRQQPIRVSTHASSTIIPRKLASLSIPSRLLLLSWKIIPPWLRVERLY